MNDPYAWFLPEEGRQDRLIVTSMLMEEFEACPKPLLLPGTEISFTIDDRQPGSDAYTSERIQAWARERMKEYWGERRLPWYRRLWASIRTWIWG